MSYLLEIDGLGKRYKSYINERKRFREWMFPWAGKQHEEHWVLRDISFNVQAGESIGLVGVNGAGKSTLLKLIAGTVKPSEGNIRKHCTVGAILELGMGFHPDFTGVQNALMALQLLGMSSEIAQEKMADVADFSELGEYLDRPVRTYSSGMQMRLAFSVATAQRPDLLIVDEALSVGDAYFQHKSFERIRNFRDLGTSLFLVSHDRNAILSLCDRAIMLNGGRVASDGKPEEIMDFYNAHIAEKEGQTIQSKTLADGSVQTSSGTYEVEIGNVVLYDDKQQEIEQVAIGQSVSVKVSCKVNEDVHSLVVGFMIKDRYGHPIYGINSFRTGQTLENLSAGDIVDVFFDFDVNLGKGNYSIAISLVQDDSHLSKNFEWRDRALIFHVLNISKEDFVGTAWLDAKISSRTRD